MNTNKSNNNDNYTNPSHVIHSGNIDGKHSNNKPHIDKLDNDMDDGNDKNNINNIEIDNNHNDKFDKQEMKL